MTNQGGNVGNCGAPQPGEGGTQPLALVLMGPSGAGKTSLGLALAGPLGAIFIDADDYHSAESLAKMSRGQGLDEDDRAPWLAQLADLLAHRQSAVVLACSALRRRYRRALGVDGENVRLVFLDVPAEVLDTRLRARRGHFAGAALLESQLETLEAPGEDEALRLDGTQTLEDCVARVVRWLAETRA